MSLGPVVCSAGERSNVFVRSVKFDGVAVECRGQPLQEFLGDGIFIRIQRQWGVDDEGFSSSR